MKSFRLVTYIIILFTITFGCSLLSPRSRNSDPFYRGTGDWESLRFPLIKPYEVVKSSEELGWRVKLELSPSKENTSYFSIKGIKKIAVDNGIIMIYSPYKDDTALSLGEKLLYWFVLIPDKSIEVGYENEGDFLEYIQDNGVKNPSWLDPNDIFKRYEKTGCLDWIPGCEDKDH